MIEIFNRLEDFLALFEESAQQKGTMGSVGVFAPEQTAAAAALAPDSWAENTQTISAAAPQEEAMEKRRTEERRFGKETPFSGDQQQNREKAAQSSGGEIRISNTSLPAGQMTAQGATKEEMLAAVEAYLEEELSVNGGWAIG